MRKTLRKMSFLVCAAFAAPACRNSNPGSSAFPFSPEAGHPAAFADVFEVVDTLALEKGVVASSAVQFVRFDGRHFTVADPTARQASVYATDGSLVQARGQLGEPVSARRARDGRLLVVDLNMRLALLSDDPETQPETMTLPFFPYDALELGDQRYLIVGVRRQSSRSSGTRPFHLHVWHSGSNAVEASFFSPPRIDFLDEFAGEGEWANVAVRGDTVWVVWQLADSIFIFQVDGSRVDAVSLPLARQTRPDSTSGVANKLWHVHSVHLLADARTIVQLDDEVAWEGGTRYLVITGADGRTHATVADTPALRVVANDLFYFQDPGRPEFDRWIVARLKPPP